jgi:membrane protein implicated in regulation of membrane protease activity
MDLFVVYLICLGVGLVFTIVTASLGHAFGGHEAPSQGEGAGGHAEAGFAGSDDMPGFAALSPTSIASFVTAFGGFGMVFTKVEALKNPWINVPLSALAGLLVAALVVTLFRFVFRRTQASSEARVAKLIGGTATIITPVPEKGVGEIAYVIAGSRYTAPARTLNGAPLPNGQAVKIARIVGSDFYVEAI